MDYKNARLVLIRLCLPPVALALAACASTTNDPTIETCTENCVLTITLPADISLPPSVPADQKTLYLKGGIDLNVEVVGEPEAKVVLLFRHDKAFRSEGERGRSKRELSVVLAEFGGQKIGVQSWVQGVCRGGSRRCKYEIHDVGNPDRPPLDPWIIIRQ